MARKPELYEFTKILLDARIVLVVHTSHVIMFYCLICKGDLESDFFFCMCISRFVPFLARRARFRLALCGPGRFFGVFVSWKHSWRSEQEHLRM